MNLAGDIPVVDGDFRLAKFEFPAAYSSYMQITLATTSVLSDLRTSGSLSGELSVKANGITSMHVAPKDLELHDNKGRLFLHARQRRYPLGAGWRRETARVEAFVVLRRRLWPVRGRGDTSSSSCTARTSRSRARPNYRCSTARLAIDTVRDRQSRR